MSFGEYGCDTTPVSTFFISLSHAALRINHFPENDPVDLFMNNITPSSSPKTTLSLKRKNIPTQATENAAHTPAKLEERLQKVLAQAGLGSRRALEQRIAEGQIKVNGDVAHIGMSLKSGDRVEFDGRSFVASALTEPSRLLIYNKPEGEVTTREDPEGRRTVFEALPALKGARWIAIGRLDINTTGLLLATTDGELAHAIMHPSSEVEREYVVRVRPPEGLNTVPEMLVNNLARGVMLEDGSARFDVIERIGSSDSHDWFRVVLKEGRNREVRRLWESQGCQVSRLKRTHYGSIGLPRELRRGQWQELPAARIATLRHELHLDDNRSGVLTLQPVIGQRRANRTTVRMGSEEGRGKAWINGHHNTADEGRELRRFDNVREEHRRGRGKPKSKGALTVSGEMAARQLQKPLKPRKFKGDRSLPEGNPAAFRPWYVPEGVNTSASGHRNAGPNTTRRNYAKPAATGATRNAAPVGHKKVSTTKSPYGQRRPNTPLFPSDYATPGANPHSTRSVRPGVKHRPHPRPSSRH